MRKIFFAALALVTWFGREWIKEEFWERALHVLSPENSIFLQYGPPTVFAALTAYFIIMSQERSGKEMLSIIMMISGVVFLVLGILLFRGETGSFPFSESGGERPAIKVHDSQLASKIVGLETLYAESGDLLGEVALLPPDTSIEKFHETDIKIDEWCVRLEKYVVTNFGKFERSRLIEVSVDARDYTPMQTYKPEIRERIASDMWSLTNLRKNIIRLIQEQKMK